MSDYLHRTPRSWSAQEVELATELLADPTTTDQKIYELLGRSRQACIDKVRRDRANPSTARPVRIQNTYCVPMIPPEVLQDRNRRLMEPKSLTARLCGDPETSRSALAQRQSA